MTHRVNKCSGQGLRFDIFNSENKRICITHTEENAKTIIRALDADERKQKAISKGFGKSPLREVALPVEE